VKVNRSTERDLEEVFNTVVALGVRCGYSHEEIRTLTDSCLERAEKQIKKEDKRDVGSKEERRILTHVLSEWGMNEKYVDDLGRPVPLTLSGEEGSLKSLYGDTLRVRDLRGQVEFQDCVDSLLSVGAIELNESGKFVRLRDDFPHHQTQGGGIQLQVEFLAQFATTIRHNVENGGGLFCSVASTHDFPVRSIAWLNGSVRQDGMNFLREIDETMEQERKSSDAGRRIRAGVGIYFFQRSSG
jgi:hypothetical protein